MVEYQIIYSTIARIDIASIKKYIKYSLKDENAAERITSAITKVIESLNISPERFEKVTYFRSEDNIRKISLKKYSIYYSVDKSDLTVTILRILFGGVDVTQIVF